MFTARATTSVARVSEISDSPTIISFAHRLMADTSAGANEVAVLNEIVRELGKPVRRDHLGDVHLREHERGVGRGGARRPRRRPTAVEIPEPEGEGDDIDEPHDRARSEQLIRGPEGPPFQDVCDQASSRQGVHGRDQTDHQQGCHP